MCNLSYYREVTTIIVGKYKFVSSNIIVMDLRLDLM